MNTVKHTMKLVSDEMSTSLMPFPVDKKLCYGWAQDIPRGGETILYTGCAYQLALLGHSYDRLIPLITKIKGIEKLKGLASKVITPSKDQVERSWQILRKMATILRKTGVEFGYLYEDEPYSGAILLEMGLIDEFKEVSKKVFSIFEKYNVKRVITVDPHTQYALLRGKEMNNTAIEIRSFYEMVGGFKASGVFTIHDSCLYSRFLGLRDAIRNIVRSSGINLIEDPMITGRDTSMCCGSPIAPVNYKVSDSIAKMRAESLKKLSPNVLVFCPFCYENLKAHVQVKDFMEVVNVE
ncbi:Fe-S oxidoreductase [Sulfolobales archaeon HS-7]|nr:Fe-S oxidoreductase [Sulfolobales archaeon HS-7]